MPRLLDEEYLSEEQPSGPSDETLPSETSGERKGGPDDGSPRNDKMAWTWKEYPWSIDLPIWLAPKPTNPGSRDHPNCRPCAFVFRLAGDCVRLRCANAESCEFCHDPSHPRYRGRHSRRKSRRLRTDRQLQEGLDKEDLPDEMDEARRGDFRIDMLDEICSNDANSTTNLSSQGKDDHVQQQELFDNAIGALHEKHTMDRVVDLSTWYYQPLSEECKMLLQWASEVQRINPANEASTRDGDEKRQAKSNSSKATSTGSHGAISKGFSSVTTLGSLQD
jgi:hypothetical protein